MARDMHQAPRGRETPPRIDAEKIPDSLTPNPVRGNGMVGVPMPDSRTFDDAELLRQARFLRSLAKRLVSDEDAADDLAQDVLVAAIERPPPETKGIRGWLSTVARKRASRFWRAHERRRRRERAAARSERLPSASEIAERTELLRLVGEAVAALPEAHRDVVHLRYYEELSPTEIAERSGTPLETIRSRLRRARELLRRRLDQAFDGDRRAWSLGLAVLAESPAAASGAALVTLGGLAMGTKTKVVILAALVGVAGLLLWRELVVGPLSGSKGDEVAVDAELPVPSSTSAPDLARPPIEPSLRAPLDREAPLSLDPAAQLAFTGRVVDGRRLGVDDVAVEISFVDGESRRTTTDGEGRFAFGPFDRFGEQERIGFVRATVGGAEVAVRRCAIAPIGIHPHSVTIEHGAPVAGGVADLGTLVLRASCRHEVIVRHEGRPVRGARVSAEALPWGPVLGTRTADERGFVAFEDFPGGLYAFTAETPAVRGDATVVLPRTDSQPTIIETAPRRTVDIRVVDERTGIGIPGAVLEMHRRRILPAFEASRVRGTSYYSEGEHIDPSGTDLGPTDEEGCARIIGLPAEGEYVVRARARGYEGHGAFGSPGVELAAYASKLTIELPSLVMRTVRWPVTDGEMPAPVEGEAVSVRPRAREPWARRHDLTELGVVRDGHVIVADLTVGEDTLLAETPSGALAILAVPMAGSVGEEVSFRRPRQAEIVVRDSRGAAVPDVVVRAFSNGLVAGPASTDAAGRVVFAGLPGGELEVQIERPGTYQGSENVGRVDLEEGDARLDVVLSELIPAIVRVTSNGIPCLPSEYAIKSPLCAIAIQDEDPDRAEIKIGIATANPEKPVSIKFTGRDYDYAYIEARPADLAEDPVLAFDLKPSYSVLITVDPPGDGRFRVERQAWDEENERWDDTWFTGGLSIPNAPDGKFRFAFQEPGLHRVLDLLSGMFEEAEVGPGVREARLHLDLSSIECVGGRVDVPPGTDFDRVRVLVEGGGMETTKTLWMQGGEPPPGIEVGSDGRFESRLPNDRPITLRAWHPFLVPARDPGEVRIQGGQKGIVLRLVAGDEVRIPLTSLEDHGMPESVRVYRFSDEPEGDPIDAWFAPIIDGEARVGGIPRGRCTLWIDAGNGYAPVALREVEIRAGLNALEKPHLALGSTLRIQVLAPSGRKAPALFVSAERLEEPTYLRSVQSRQGSTEIALPGLGPGRFHVSILEWPGNRHEQVVEVDGVTDLDVVLDLR